MWAGNRAPIKEEAPVIATNGQGFLVTRDSGEVVKVGTEADSTIIVNRIRGGKGNPP
ncbi:hypothetical protein NON20_24350 (plasmid) [Synechocystis sp. B12]|nr:hypothetical protein NON20_24350 [Synechocystis sp. B12]